MNQEHLSRIQKLQHIMAAEDLDAIFLYSEINRAYFTGLNTSNGLLLIERQGTPRFYTDFRYIEVAQRSLSGIEICTFKPNAEQIKEYATLARAWKTIGYEGSLTVAQFLPLQEALSHATWKNATQAIATIRGVKSPAEIEILRRSAATNDDVLAEMIKTFHPGMSERDMQRIFRTIVAQRGIMESFEPIFCAGVNAVECHHHPDDTVLQPESELLIDMGVLVDGYCSDMTRTLYYGTPTPRFKEIHDIVLEANQAVIAQVKPGMRCCDVDTIARDIIKKYGYGDYFGHSLGHSVGLEIHEMPAFGQNCTTVLEPGMVLTDEPGIYISGQVGVRIEDLLVITETGCEVLSHTPHEIILPC